MSTPRIEIIDYDPRWPATFAAEAQRIREALGTVACRIDHVGSTSVPGLAAKPVIDISVSVQALQPMDPYRDPLHAIGYTHVPHPDDSFAPFFHRPAQWPHTHHIHVCEHGGLEERRQLAFRDFLRDHPDVAKVYADTKRGLAPSASAATFDSRNAYADAKSSFIEPIIRRALEEGYPRG